MHRFAALCGMFVWFALVLSFAQQQTSTEQNSEKKTGKHEETARAQEKEKTPSEPAEKRPGNPENASSAHDKQPAKDEHWDVSEIPPSVTHHQITVNGRILRYTATAGRLPIKRDDGKIEAEMFFVAYTLDGQDSARRPLTFAFNGGPGSASIWLHMGALGPRRVVLRPDGFLPPAPYHIEDNRYTLLDSSDLVLVDAIGTGFSRAADAELSKKYWGLKGDIDSFSEFIRLYITRNERWNSPLFLFGESYGTTRAAGVAGNLAGQGISFNGITLLSMALTFQTLVDNRSNDEPYVLLIPSFASAAWFHKKLPADLMADADKARQEAARWAVTDYAQALAKGDSLSAEERQKAIDQMSRYTGLSKDVIDQANLRIDVAKFTHYLLLDQKLRVGRLDGRFTGPDPDGVLDTAFYDPTEASILPPFTSVYNQYVRAELGYQTDLPYHTFISDPQFEEKWEWGQGINGFPDTATALRQAMVKNSYLKIMVMEGFYDLATPYFAADYTVDHLNLGSAYQKNISKATYEAGHMVYLLTDELKKMKGDEAQFITRSMQQ